MVIVEIIGGLGNQMFQYAFGRSLANKLGCELLLDIKSFDGYGLHNGFELKDVFGVIDRIADNNDMRRILGWKLLPKKLLRKSYFSLLNVGGNYLVEREYCYQEINMDVDEDVYVVGYFQSYKYFKDCILEVRDIFSFTDDEYNSPYLYGIKNTESVSIHVRRGDYVEDKKSNAIHGIKNDEYYEEAINKIMDSLENPIFYVFSDDIDWVEKKYSADNYIIVKGNQKNKSYIDMYLMANCKNNIIANSSFSWWAAWLNNNPKKIVIAPMKWFNSSDFDTLDLCPSEWIRV